MSMLCVGNSSVVKIYIIRPKAKLGPVAKNATPRPSGWESNPRPRVAFFATGPGLGRIELAPKLSATVSVAQW